MEKSLRYIMALINKESKNKIIFIETHKSRAEVVRRQ